MVQERFVVWGTDENDERILVGIDFNKQNYEVNVYLIPHKHLEKEIEQSILNEWSEGEDVQLPDTTIVIPRPLSEETLLPDTVKVKETFTIRRLQNEWAYYMLTSKLWENFQDELASLKRRVMELTHYDKAVFEECKEYWGRLLAQKKEKNISQEKLDEFKEELNLIFDKLKSFRKEETKQFDDESVRQKDDLMAEINAVADAIGNQSNNYKQLFDTLKNIQTRVKQSKLRKNHRNVLHAELNKSFEMLISKRKEFSAGKLMRRIEGLGQVIDKMNHSIVQDRKELEFHNRKSNHSRATSIEIQLRQAKIKVLEDRILSKEKKLEEIKETYEQLRDKLKQ